MKSGGRLRKVDDEKYTSLFLSSLTMWILSLPYQEQRSCMPTASGMNPEGWGLWFMSHESGQILATSHDLGRQKVAEEVKSPYFREIWVGEI